MKTSVKRFRRLDVLIDDVQREGQRTDRIVLGFSKSFLDYSPTPNLLPVRDLLGHIAAIYLFCARAYRDDVWNEIQPYLHAPMPDLEAVTRTLASARDAAITAIQNCPPVRLRGTVIPILSKADSLGIPKSPAT
jgi:hypothetical protein